MSTEESKTCFVISPIGEEGSPIRDRADKIYNYVISPIIREAGYKVSRADKLSVPGLITSQIVEQILECDLVVADLTGRNPNVYYELAVRHAIRKPFIQIVEAGESLPFDIAGMRTISINHTDLESVENCKIEIKKQIESIAGNPDQVNSPISVSVTIQSLQRGENPIDIINEELLSRIQLLQTDTNNIDQRTETIRQGLTAIMDWITNNSNLQVNPVDMGEISFETGKLFQTMYDLSGSSYFVAIGYDGLLNKVLETATSFGVPQSELAFVQSLRSSLKRRIRRMTDRIEVKDNPSRLWTAPLTESDSEDDDNSTDDSNTDTELDS